MYKLIIDDREGAVTKHLTNPPLFPTEVKRILRGDYALEREDNTLAAVFERKSLADFGASIKDGRVMNREVLEELQKTCGCKIFYIIEGRQETNDKALHGGIPYSTIRASIYRLMYFEGFQIIWTRDTKDTLAQLYAFMKAIANAEPARADKLHNIVGNAEDLLSAPRKKKDDIFLAWQAIPGIGKGFAADLMKTYSLSDIILHRVSRESLEAWRGSGSRLNRKQVSALLLSNTVEILSALHGVSKTIALAVAASSDEVFQSEALLSKVKVGNRELGKARASSILTAINLKQTIEG